MPIRSKLMIFFIIIFLILSSSSLFIFFNYQDSIEQYEHVQDRFFSLNDVSQKSSETYELMNSYLNSQSQRDLTLYNESRKQLIVARDRLQVAFVNQGNSIVTKNYQNMVDSLVEESDLALVAFFQDDLEVYSSKQKEAFMLLGFIQEQTLSLLNNDLTMFNDYYDAMNKRNEWMQLTLIFIIITTFLVGLLTAYFFSNGITKPISKLTNAAKDIASGKLDGPELPLSHDEIGFLSQTFNQMRRDLVYFVREIKDKSEQDKLLKEMELKSLQSQINPHFLFNTLNTISKCAIIEGSDQVYKLINSLSKLLRYNLSKIEKPVTLLDELAVVKEYFFIQKTRFDNRVDFSVDVSDDCLSLEIPILTLQPLVENAFIHGIEPFENKGVIQIIGYRIKNYFCLEIIDNGIGMTEEEKQRILNRSERLTNSAGHSTGLGIENVVRRLELFYQCEDVFSIDSAEGNGTTIKLKLPIGEGKEDTDV